MEESPESVSAMLQRKLHIGQDLADSIVAGGLTTVEEVAYVPLAEFIEVSRPTIEEATALRSIAQKYLLNEALDNDS